ncbi:DUF2231 domain-containing protein [Nocardioides insulae]|uniref:DUF2231 domain-containing protein n=1 Tax=Nocardioides insulae TaxID=394734 RepID=UPI0004097039|nr:DUF2231 domain-containing protein [Nocardioides insulae]
MTPTSLPGPARWAARLEEAETLDGPIETLEPHIRKAFGTGTKGKVLRGEWLGHALHPALTDVVLGTWTSALVLDLIGGRDSARAAQRLIGVGLVAFGPTAWSGWAEWVEAGPREKRVGLVHAVTNAAAVGGFAASWLARARGRHGAGVVLGMAGAGAMAGAAYLGGHLATVRRVGSVHPAYDADPVGPASAPEK